MYRLYKLYDYAYPQESVYIVAENSSCAASIFHEFVKSNTEYLMCCIRPCTKELVTTEGIFKSSDISKLTSDNFISLRCLVIDKILKTLDNGDIN